LKQYIPSYPNKEEIEKQLHVKKSESALRKEMVNELKIIT
jgi:hypothetical protein